MSLLLLSYAIPSLFVVYSSSVILCSKALDYLLSITLKSEPLKVKF